MIRGSPLTAGWLGGRVHIGLLLRVAYPAAALLASSCEKAPANTMRRSTSTARLF